MCDKPNVFTSLIDEQAPALPRPPELDLSSLPPETGTRGSPPHRPTGLSPPRPCPVVGGRGERRGVRGELPSQALCPMIGVCLPMPLLRRRISKLVGGNAMANDYELHCGAINDCGHRSAVAEGLQRELDQRYLRAIRLAAQHKTTEALGRWWDAAQQGNDVAGSLWAVLTHSRCDSGLQEQVLRDIHMLQHQVGAANRADLQRLEELADQNAVLGRELAQTQTRTTRLLQERALTIERQAAELVQKRAELLGRDTLNAGLRGELHPLAAARPGLRNRQEQAEQIRLQLARIHELERGLLAAQQQAERQRRPPHQPT